MIDPNCALVDQALELLDHGVSVIPILYGQKKPAISWREFQTRLPKEDEILSWFDNGHINIGIVTGQISNLVVVDSDGPEGERWIREKLVDTPLKVKTSAGFHHYYRHPGGGIKIKNMVGIAKGVDIRGDGGYVVAPPSMHEDGRKYVWVIDGNPWDGDIKSLPLFNLPVLHDTTQHMPGNLGLDLSSVKPLAVIREAVPGERNATLAQLVGKWISDGKNKEEVLLMAKGWNVDNPKPLGIEEVSRTVESVIKTHQRNHPLLISPKPVYHQETENTPLPDHLLTIPGVLGDVVEYYNRSAPISQPGFAVQTALAIGSVLLARRFRTTNDNYSSLYFLCIAKSASGKEHIKTVIDQVLFQIGKESLIGGNGYTSGGAVYSSLLLQPAHLTVIDEFGKHLEATKGSHQTYKKEANTVLMEVIGRCGGVLRPPTYSSMTKTKREQFVFEERNIYSPGLSLISLTTPFTFYDNVSTDQIKDGFLGRFIIHHSYMPRENPNERRRMPVPESLRVWTDHIDERLQGSLSIMASPNIMPEVVELKFTEPAYQFLLEFNRFKLDLMDSLGEIESIAGRIHEFAMKISMIVALSRDPFAQTIELSDAMWAVDYMRYAILQTISHVNRRVSDSEFEANKKKVLDAMRSRGEKGLTKREANREPPFSAYTEKTLNEIISALTAAEQIEYRNLREGKPGVPRWAYVAIADELRQSGDAKLNHIDAKLDNFNRLELYDNF